MSAPMLRLEHTKNAVIYGHTVWPDWPDGDIHFDIYHAESDGLPCPCNYCPLCDTEGASDG